MGLTMSMIEKMQGMGLFGKGGIRLLDIGSSNLYQASHESILAFLSTYGVDPSEENTIIAERLAKGSAYDSITGGTNGAFAGELFQRAGFRYDAIDIADGYKTTILDLNHQAAPKNFIRSFDLVINYGTTEHLLNQYNAFKVIHDSTKLGGHMIHSLPCVGYSNHGYFTYTPRCMFDMAGYNEYEVVSFSFDGPGAINDLYAPVRDYSSYFPSLTQVAACQNDSNVGRFLKDLKLPDISLFIVYRKVKDKTFAGALEMTTSVGRVPSTVSSKYSTQ